MSKQQKILDKKRAANPYPDVEDILNEKNLRQAVSSDKVKVVPHPTLPLRLFCYSSLRHMQWNQTTRMARGLLVTSKQKVVARPFEKYFGPEGNGSIVPKLDWHTADMWTEKLDGTMIVASNFEGQLVLSTKASFESPQIDAAHKLWPKNILPHPGQTWVLEYFGYDNPHVVPYQSPAQLALLAVRDNWTGVESANVARQMAIECGLTFPRIASPERVEAILAGDDENWEGFVATWFWAHKPPHRVKLKTQWFKDRKAELFAAKV
jgi:hypothetical protein